MTEWRGGWLGWKRATRPTLDPRHTQENSPARLVLANSFRGREAVVAGAKKRRAGTVVGGASFTVCPCATIPLRIYYVDDTERL